MEPIYESISANLGSSFHAHYFEGGCCKPLWHIHPEYELVYIHSGSAVRHIGCNVSCYEDGDLMLIGSNIPHSNLGNVDFPDNHEIVVQMGVEFIENKLNSITEFQQITDLFKRSGYGISFNKSIKQQVGGMLKELIELEPFEKLLKLLKIFKVLAQTKDYQLLNVDLATVEIQSNDYSRIQKINSYVANHYEQTIQLKEMAHLTGLTETSFSRFFRKVTGKTFSTFLNEYRIQKASSFLIDCNNSITEVMLASGFTEPAHFSRTFKRITNQTPSEYRKKRKNWY